MTDLVERLRQLDSCAVSDALDKLGLDGVAAGIGRVATDKRIAGRVLTVTLGATPPAEHVRHLCTAAIDAAEPGDVIVVEQHTGIVAAGWGGILSNAALHKGVSGAIVDGPARDVDEAHEIGFPVFARSATCRTARGRVYEVAFNQPIQLGGVEVRPGDYVLADGSGTTVIRAEDLDHVVAAAERIAARERLMTVAARAGEPISTVMGRDYETLLDRGAQE